MTLPTGWVLTTTAGGAFHRAECRAANGIIKSETHSLSSTVDTLANNHVNHLNTKATAASAVGAY